MLYPFQRCRHARTQELGSSPRGLQTGTGSILRRLGQNHLDAARPKHGREHRAHCKRKGRNACLQEQPIYNSRCHP
ncbi:Uncharacterized protein HZ326_1557 [Fusarium oxysporum f. sp. albedinis]|nr:Uncharacterized protein HZ326_1557 [Fusarium oxysporum f. sp. albedinis]